jgi:DNA-binding beta-propeller fold protein YncE
MSVRRAALVALAAFSVSTVMMWTVIPTAFAETEVYSEISSFAAVSPQHIAVETSTGDVFLLDEAEKKVVKFNPEGRELGSITGVETPAKEFTLVFSAVEDIAVDSSTGDVYVSVGGFGEPGTNVIDKFKPKTPGSNEYEYSCQLTGTGNGCVREHASDGNFFPAGIAVNAAGDLYVAIWKEEEGPRRIEEYGTSGENVKTFETKREAPVGVAVDAGGDVYVLEYTDFLTAPVRVSKFNEAGEPQPDGEVEALGEGVAFAIAIDPATNELFVLDNSSGYHVERFNEEGALLEEFAQSAEIVEGTSIAYGPFNNDVYVTDAHAPDEVHIYEKAPPPVPPEVECGPPTVAPESLTLKGTVNPKGQEGTHYYFIFDGGQGPSKALPTSATSEPVEQEVTGLEPNALYRYQLFSYNEHRGHRAELPVGCGEQEVRTAAIVPRVNCGAAPDPAAIATAEAATLVVSIDPENSPTSFHFQYASEEEYAEQGYTHETPVESAGEGFFPIFLRQQIEGLRPGTTYRVRVTAEDQAGVVHGCEPDASGEETFTTGTEGMPVVHTAFAASDVTQTSAVVSGTVNPEGEATNYVFEIGAEEGASSEYNIQISGELPAGTATDTVSAAVEGLAPGTTFRYRLAAVNSKGTSYGEGEMFTTLPATQPPAAAVSPYALAQPPTPPQLAVPQTAFPTETGTYPPTHSKLEMALNACRRKARRLRAACERLARRKYGPPVHSKKKRRKR